jgi:hypothetical protein
MPPEATEILFIKRFDMTKGIEGQRLNRNSNPLSKKSRFSVTEMSTQGKKKGECPIRNGNKMETCNPSVFAPN